jgi:hypothetical protein
MYPCIRQTYGGFFEVVCRSEDRQLTFRDPPLASNSPVDSGKHILVAHRSGFMQKHSYGFWRMYLPCWSMRWNHPSGIMLMVPTPWGGRVIGKRRNFFYVGRRELGIG